MKNQRNTREKQSRGKNK